MTKVMHKIPKAEICLGQEDHERLAKEQSLEDLVIWNVTKALEKAPKIPLKATIKAMQDDLDNKRFRNLATNTESPEQYLTCAVLAWQQLGHDDADSLYSFIESHRNEIGNQAKVRAKVSEKLLGEMLLESGLPALPPPRMASSYGEVLRLPLSSEKFVMRMDQVPVPSCCAGKNQTSSTLQDYTFPSPHDMKFIKELGCICNKECTACTDRLSELEEEEKELRARAEQLAQRETERAELLEKATATWVDLEAKYHSRLNAAKEQAEIVINKMEREIDHRKCLKKDCKGMVETLKNRSTAAGELQKVLKDAEGQVCMHACRRMTLMEEVQKVDAAFTDQQCNEARLDRDLKFNEQQTRRKLFAASNDLESAQALSVEAQRAMRAELNALRDQILDVSDQLLEEDKINEHVKLELEQIHTQKADLIKNLDGCKERCDLKMEKDLKSLQTKKEELDALEKKFIECQCKKPVEKVVEVKRTPSLAMTCTCIADGPDPSCTCKSLSSVLLSNLLASLFRGLQSELGDAGIMMSCSLLKCLEDGHNWDKSTPVKSQLKAFFSRLLIGELDIAIAVAIEKYHARWVGATCADMRAIPNIDDEQARQMQEKAIERKAQRLANKLAEDLFKERAEELAQSARDICEASPTSCECEEKGKDAAVYSCIVTQNNPMSGSRALEKCDTQPFRNNSVNKDKYQNVGWKQTQKAVIEMKAEIENLKKASIKKQDLRIMEEKLKKVIQGASLLNTAEESNKHRKSEKNHIKDIKTTTKAKCKSTKDKSSERSRFKSPDAYKKLGQSYAVNVCLCEQTQKQIISKQNDVRATNKPKQNSQPCPSNCVCFNSKPNTDSLDRFIENWTKDMRETCLKLGGCRIENANKNNDLKVTKTCSEKVNQGDLILIKQSPVTMGSQNESKQYKIPKQQQISPTNLHKENQQLTSIKTESVTDYNNDDENEFKNNTHLQISKMDSKKEPKQHIVLNKQKISEHDQDKTQNQSVKTELNARNNIQPNSILHKKPSIRSTNKVDEKTKKDIEILKTHRIDKTDVCDCSSIDDTIETSMIDNEKSKSVNVDIDHSIFEIIKETLLKNLGPIKSGEYNEDFCKYFDDKINDSVKNILGTVDLQSCQCDEIDTQNEKKKSNKPIPPYNVDKNYEARQNNSLQSSNKIETKEDLKKKIEMKQVKNKDVSLPLKETDSSSDETSQSSNESYKDENSRFQNSRTSQKNIKKPLEFDDVFKSSTEDLHHKTISNTEEKKGKEINNFNEHHKDSELKPQDQISQIKKVTTKKQKNIDKPPVSSPETTPLHEEEYQRKQNLKLLKRISYEKSSQNYSTNVLEESEHHRHDERQYQPHEQIPNQVITKKNMKKQKYVEKSLTPPLHNEEHKEKQNIKFLKRISYENSLQNYSTKILEETEFQRHDQRKYELIPNLVITKENTKTQKYVDKSFTSSPKALPSHKDENNRKQPKKHLKTVKNEISPQNSSSDVLENIKKHPQNKNKDKQSINNAELSPGIQDIDSEHKRRKVSGYKNELSIDNADLKKRKLKMKQDKSNYQNQPSDKSDKSSDEISQSSNENDMDKDSSFEKNIKKPVRSDDVFSSSATDLQNESTIEEIKHDKENNNFRKHYDEKKYQPHEKRPSHEITKEIINSQKYFDKSSSSPDTSPVPKEHLGKQNTKPLKKITYEKSSPENSSESYKNHTQKKNIDQPLNNTDNISDLRKRKPKYVRNTEINNENEFKSELNNSKNSNTKSNQPENKNYSSFLSHQDESSNEALQSFHKFDQSFENSEKKHLKTINNESSLPDNSSDAVRSKTQKHKKNNEHQTLNNTDILPVLSEYIGTINLEKSHDNSKQSSSLYYSSPKDAKNIGDYSDTLYNYQNSHVALSALPESNQNSGGDSKYSEEESPISKDTTMDAECGCDYKIKLLGVTLTRGTKGSNKGSPEEENKDGKTIEKSQDNNNNNKVTENTNITNKQTIKHESFDQVSCICCHDSKGKKGFTDLEENTFSLLEEYMKKRLEEYRMSCTSKCYNSELEERMFDEIFRNVKRTVSENVKQIDCQCDEDGKKDESKNRAYNLLQEYLKMKIDRVKCQCEGAEGYKGNILADMYEKVCNQIENDFLRIKNLCNCEKSAKENLKKKHGFEFEAPERDTNGNSKIEIKIGNSVKMVSVQNSPIKQTENISSQVSNIKTETNLQESACGPLEKEFKNIQTGESISCTCQSFECCAATVINKKNQFVVQQCTDVLKKNSDSHNSNHNLANRSLGTNHVINAASGKSSNNMETVKRSYPYIGYTIDFSGVCNKSESCSCPKCIARKNKNYIQNMWSVYTNGTKPIQNFSYIMDSVAKVDMINSSILDNITSCSNVLSISQCDQQCDIGSLQNDDMVLKVSKEKLRTVAKASSFSGDSFCESPYKKLFDINLNSCRRCKDGSSSISLSRSSCDCRKVPMCHVKLLMESIEYKLIESKCTCDALDVSVCPIHSMLPTENH